MENNEGIPDLNEVYAEDVEPIRMVPPVFINGQLCLGILPPREVSYTSLGDDIAGPSTYGMKRGKEKTWNPSYKLKAAKLGYHNMITEEDKKNGNRNLVTSVLICYDGVRRRLSQVENAQGDIKVTSDTMKYLGLYTNKSKRTGAVPGVEVGDIFYCGGEMDVVGLHAARISMDELERVNQYGELHSVVISIVDTGKNADENHQPHFLVVTGYGGTDKYGSGQPSDKKLGKMNLKLHNAMTFKTPVRVIRSVKDQKRTQGKIYIYDGIYNVMEVWHEKNEANCKVYKVLLIRRQDQGPAFAIWKDIETWQSNIIARPYLLLEDLSFGVENLKVRLVNEFDGEEGPARFAYLSSLQYSLMNVQLASRLCSCPRKSCGQGDGNCLCIDRNGGDIPYIDSGILVTRRPMVYECGGSCRCSAECKNRMIQTGLKFTFEVFKTQKCGWGLRSWDPIRAGSFICEYAGEVVQNSDEEDDYIFDTSRVYHSFLWNYIPEAVGEDACDRVPEEVNLKNRMVISAKKVGNVARFMNHGCTPNVLWQPISREQDGKLYIHFGFFAIKHIPPLTELRYDYGTSGGRGIGKKHCLCGSEYCRGSFG